MQEICSYTKIIFTMAVTDTSSNEVDLLGIYVHSYATVHMYIRTYPNMYTFIVYNYAKQKHLGCKKVRGQSEATLQTGRRDQKV